MNNFTVFILLTIITSCGIPQSDFDALKSENDSLKNELGVIKSEKMKLEKKAEIEERKRQARVWTDEEALRLLKDYYSFYNADMKFRNPRVRRVSNNKFRISLEECLKKGGFEDDDFFWRSEVISLTINEDGTYKIN